MTQAQVDAINSGITKSIVDSRVIPSSTEPGYAANAEYADTANFAATANAALTSYYSEIAGTANNAKNSNTALSANTATTANTALSANTADTANSVKDYSETLLSGLTEDDVPVSFYILTKNS